MFSAHPYRTATPPPPGRRRIPDDGGRDARRVRVLLFTLALLAAWTGFLAWREHRLNVAVAAMPAVMQAAAFGRVHDELSTTCATQPQLADRCHAQAEFILRFPQCDDDCQQLARRFLPVARR